MSLVLRSGLTALLLLTSAGGAGAQPPLSTNATAIAELTPPGTLAIADPLAVFAYVLGALPERVQVLPTENYHYFRFLRGGVPYTGNIRLAAADRDQGRLHFAYGRQPSARHRQPAVRHTVLDAERGVRVEKLAPLTYRVSHGDKTVTFALNDLSQVKPPAGLLRADEKFLGPLFDESGLRFFLAFNERLRVFHYLLDETAKVPDDLLAAKTIDRILIGRRTGFAFYRDGARKLLIGVNRRNSQLNTHFDGPFDQLPENFIDGEALREAIVAASPDVKGKIDRFGNFIGGSDRYLIHPYLLYRQEADLTVFHRCLTQVPAASRPLCFVIDDDEAQKPKPRPAGLQRRR